MEAVNIEQDCNFDEGGGVLIVLDEDEAKDE